MALTSRRHPSPPKQISPFIIRRRFEALLLTAAGIEIAHLIGLFARRLEVDGWTLALIFTFLVPWIAPGLGFAITRKGSTVAKWLLVVLVAVTLVSAISIGVGRWNELAILLGAIAGVLQCLAVAMLFSPAGRSLTSRRKA